MFFDLDHFKRINDQYGHQIGDELLKKIGYITNKVKREYDIAGRYGGEEFLIILPEANKEQAEKAARKLMEEIRKAEIITDRGILRISASFGISSLIDNSALIEKDLRIESLEKIYNVSDPLNADWENINRQKRVIADYLIRLSDIAMYKAKNNYCGNCGETFSCLPKECPGCGSSDIREGRNRIVVI